MPGDLAVNGGDITTTNATGNLFNTNAVIVNIGDAATTEVNIGSASSGRVQIKPNTIVGANTTQNVFNTVATTVNAFGAATAVNIGANSGIMTIGNPTVVGTQTTQNLYNTTATTVNAFGAATAINMGAATGTTTIGHDLSVNGQVVKINADNTAADSFLYFNGTTEYLKWDNTNSRFELSDQLYISQTDVPAVFERRTTTTEVNPNEAKGALRLYERVTDAANNNTDDAGPAVVFGRTSGATDATERLFATMGAIWYGTTTKADLQFNWSTDNYTEVSNQYPLTYTLLRLNSDYAEFFNNSIYVDYANVASTKTATSITGGNTLVFGTAHGYTAGTRILYQTATANGLIQSSYYYVIATGLTSTQCQVSTTSGGTAVTLTNGTGLTLTFAEVNNRVGINTDTPAYTLDVNGNANISGVVTVQGDAVTINSDKTDTDVYVNFGRVAPGNNAAIRWNATTDSFEWSADSTTWYDFIDVVLTNPQEGQSIIYNGTNWENSNEFEFTNTAYRSQFINNSSTVGSITAAEFLKRRASLVDGNVSGIFMGQVVGSTETYTHRSLSQYSTAGNNQYLIQIDPVGNFIPGSTTVISQLAVDNTDLLLAAPDITLNAYGVGSAGVDAGLTIERGTSGGDATFKWIESNIRFEANASIYSLGNLIADGSFVKINADADNADSFLYMKGTTEYLKWDDGLAQFELSDDLEVGGNLQVSGDNIKKSTGTTVITFSGTNLTTLAGDLQVSGDTIKKSGGTDVIQFSGTDTVSVPGLFQVEIAGTDAQINIGSEAAIATIQTPTSTTTQVPITTSGRNSMSGLITIEDNTGARHTLNFTMLRNGAGSPLLTTYGELYTGTALATFAADLNSGDIRLLATPASSNDVTFNVIRTASF